MATRTKWSKNTVITTRRRVLHVAAKVSPARTMQTAVTALIAGEVDVASSVEVDLSRKLRAARHRVCDGGQG